MRRQDRRSWRESANLNSAVCNEMELRKTDSSRSSDHFLLRPKGTLKQSVAKGSCAAVPRADRVWRQVKVGGSPIFVFEFIPSAWKTAFGAILGPKIEFLYVFVVFGKLKSSHGGYISGYFRSCMGESGYFIVWFLFSSHLELKRGTSLPPNSYERICA